MHRVCSITLAFLAAFTALIVFGVAFSPIAQAGAQPQAGADSAPPSANQSQTPPSPAPEPEAGKFVLKSQVPLVVLDIVVTDKKGQPVQGLKQSEFTVTEKGQEMTVQSFEEHRADQAPPAAPPRPPLPPNVFTNLPSTPKTGPLNILLMDALNTPMGDQSYVHNKMIQYLKKLPEGTRIAIFGLSSHLYILQGFNTDPAVLKAALNSKKGLPSYSPLLADPITMGTNSLLLTPEELTRLTTLRVQYTLGAMDDLARYLSSLPGRKNLIWFSASFPINIFTDGTQTDPFGVAMEYADWIKSTCDLLTWAQVAVYPVDARGLFNDPGNSPVSRTTSIGPRTLQAATAGFFANNTAENTTMSLMADETGGKAFFNTNDLNAAVQEAINQGSNYYTLSYTPSNRQWDGSYRSVRVKLDQPGVDLFYHRGYYAEDPHAASVRGEKGLPVKVMQGAMRRGGPGATEILFDAHIVPAAGTDDTLPPGNEPNANKKMKPPYRHYAIRYFADIGHMAFSPTPDGKYHGSLECIALLYNPEGEMLNSTTTRVNLNPTADRYKLMLQNGVGLRQEIAAPAKGEYFLRLGVHDLASDRVGAVEVPLEALQAEPATAAAPSK